MIKLVFFGSSKYSTIVEEAVFKKFGLSLVVTLPDRLMGRKKILSPNPVKEFAQKNRIDVLTTDKIDSQIIEKIKTLRPDFLVVADFGLILPKELLDTPKYAPLNVHHSLLPKYRGPSPAPTAILNGEKISGVTIIKMSEGIDVGDILAQKEYELKKDETTDSLLTALNTLGAEIILPVIENYNSIKPLKQDESKASFTKRMTKQDGCINLQDPPSPEIIDRMIRAYYPWPGAWGKWQMANGKWQIVKFLPDRKVQAEGGKPMPLKDFINGYPQSKPILQKLFRDKFVKEGGFGEKI